ncbi:MULTISPECIES: ABC transporter permease subunit [unclassified Mesorhizobium]|uniref:ABC transporter permease subunit n=1 Tax=unclassified Mesorhizobium TaxID=325217 RepID=UPI0011296386|nr:MULTISPECIES: ABC transporter permease subunit [unclassified Mesorhizobium]TPJ46010.1 ABC transporter permease subunit [Mesorhizobium sp. B2-6-6]MBZ9894412.1 ABC transporter permease subunit [Mesorhizobium sp. BR1-1-6]MCA0008500.1 ABC transporter permease subunit [Mesorhizobium sp. B264B1B]MCA0022546.1 ABC transporter permease subunit [Mesorhizobium sp. B264B1A]MCA0025719.1 ABC transporter permease subunit [Mesorhizobium sp. B263B1A]
MSGAAFRIERGRFAEESFCSRIHWRHGLWLVLAFFGSLAFAYAQSDPQQQAPSAIATLILWLPFILKGFALNLLMSFIAMAVATLLGIGLGLLRVSRSKLLRTPAWFVTHLFRNSPWLVILFTVMLLVPFEMRLPGAGTVAIPDWIKATFAFSLPVMANISEVLRGAINSIPKGQWESAESLAFTRGQTLRWIILPQCVRRAIPPWMNWYALLALATPMASILGVHEAVGNAQAAMEAAGARPEFLIPFYLFLLCLFFAYIYPIAIWTRKLERKYVVAS